MERLQRRRLARPPALVAIALAGALAACGGSASSGQRLLSAPPARVLAAARSAALGAATVRIAGSILTGAQPISIDMELVADKGGMGAIEIGPLRMRLVELDKLLYLDGNSALYERLLGPAAAARLRGAWLRGAQASRALAPFVALADPRDLLGTLLRPSGNLERAGARLVRGSRAIALRDQSTGATLYLAASGTPYPLEIRWAHGGALDFEDWNGPAEIQAPAHELSIQELERAP